MKKTIGAVVIALAFLAPLAVQAQEEVAVSANAGWVSQYYYRGVPQKTSSASAGLDLGISGLYLGTWAADVGDGAEVDLYGGVGVDLEGFSLSAGGTGYFYTGDYDDTYLEANLGAGYGALSVEFSYGTYDDSDDSNYWFLGVTAEHEGFYGTFGTFGGDDTFYADEGMYGEVGYGFSAADLDFTISGIFNDDILSGQATKDEDGEYTGPATEELTLVFGVSKTFEIN